MEVPTWAQEALVWVTGILAVLMGAYRYVSVQIDKHKKSSSGPKEMLAASFLDSRTVNGLRDALREHQNEFDSTTDRMIRSQTKLREDVKDNTEAVKVHTDALLNLIRFLSTRTPPQD